MDTFVEQLQLRVTDARVNGIRLCVTGTGSKLAMAANPEAEPVNMRDHAGIISYEPSELVVRVRAGTRLDELEKVLAEHGQYLPFDPPRFNGDGSVGGAVAAGLSGPGLPYLGGARDYVLGCRMINGYGEAMRFGGEVMKNVAGYDVPRLMTGSRGQLGILTDVSLKVLPIPEQTMTLQLQAGAELAERGFAEMRQRFDEISGMLFDGENMLIRVQGYEAAVNRAVREIGGEQVDNSAWQQLRDHEHNFFDLKQPLYRVSVPVDTSFDLLSGRQLVDWGGALRWVQDIEPTDADIEQVRQSGGYIHRFRPGTESAGIEITEKHHPLLDRIREAFDPDSVFRSEG